MKLLLALTITLLATVVWVQGTSPIFVPPKKIIECSTSEKICVEECYSPDTQNCLTYKDGSGGTVCTKGDIYCGGKCLTPGEGKVCLKGQSGYEVICNEGQSVCSFSKCYEEDTHDCVNGHTLCPKGEILCGHGAGSCYKPSDQIVCLKGDFNSYLCNRGEKLCRGRICYDPLREICLKDERRICTVGDQPCIHLYNRL